MISRALIFCLSIAAALCQCPEAFCQEGHQGALDMDTSPEILHIPSPPMGFDLATGLGQTLSPYDPNVALSPELTRKLMALWSAGDGPAIWPFLPGSAFELGFITRQNLAMSFPPKRNLPRSYILATAVVLKLLSESGLLRKY